jgi:hypothetical protein
MSFTCSCMTETGESSRSVGPKLEFGLELVLLPMLLREISQEEPQGKHLKVQTDSSEAARDLRTV